MTDEEQGFVTVAWSVNAGNVGLPADYADWLGAGLSILIAAVHHPEVLAAQQPDTDAATVAREVLEEIPVLTEAWRAAEAQQPAGGDVDVTLAGSTVWIAPGAELGGLIGLLETFARSVLDPVSPEAATAHGASAHVAAAWSKQLGAATGAL